MKKKWGYLSPFSWSFSLFSFLPLASFDDTLLESDVWDKSNSFDTSTLSAKRDFFCWIFKVLNFVAVFVCVVVVVALSLEKKCYHFKKSKFLINVNNIKKKLMCGKYIFFQHLQSVIQNIFFKIWVRALY
jgi:hypothetical protein